MNKNIIKKLALPTAGALVLAISALGGSAFATDTVPAPIHSVSPIDPSMVPSMDSSSTDPSMDPSSTDPFMDSSSTDPSMDPSSTDPSMDPSSTDPSMGSSLTDPSTDVEATLAISSEGDVQSVLDGQLVGDADVQAILGNVQIENIGDQNVDLQVDSVNNDNNSEEVSFTEDIAAANQAGENGDSVGLTESASIMTSITLPEVKAMVSDDTEAHDLLVGTPSK